MIEFKPEYSRKTIVGYVVAICLSVMSIYLFIDSGYKEFKLLAFPLLMIVYIILFTKFVLIKNIIFDDSIHIERFLWKKVIIQYAEIEHITFASLKAGKRIILFQGILNESEFLDILNKKAIEGKINIDNAKNQKVANKQYTNMSFVPILLLLLFIIQGISLVFPYHLINSVVDGFIVWSIIYLIYQSIINKKFD